VSKGYYNQGDLEGAVRMLNGQIRAITFEDNFTSFKWEGSITAGDEVIIPNRFKNGAVPTQFLVTYAKGSSDILAGDTKWDTARVSLKNNGATDATLIVHFLR
jgi:hypothetical protein